MTTGGSTSGRWTSPSSSALPQKCLRASSHATRDAERQRDDGGDERDLQRQVDRDPFIGGELEHGLITDARRAMRRTQGRARQYQA